jgi:hypothetical protein
MIQDTYVGDVDLLTNAGDPSAAIRVESKLGGTYMTVSVNGAARGFGSATVDLTEDEAWELAAALQSAAEASRRFRTNKERAA